MKDTCTIHSARDWRQRYEGTVGKYIKPNGQGEWVYITRIRDHQVEFQDKHGTDLAAVHDTGVTFEFTQVIQGWTMHPEYGPVHMSRVPARQWQRGISGNNTSLVYIRGGKIAHLRVDLTLVGELLDPAKPTKFDPASCVLEREFAIACGTLYFHRQQAGTVKDNVITLNGVYDIRQELSDSIRRNNYPLEIA